MGFGWARNNLTPIGIDFGADSVKLLQVVAEDPPQLTAAAAVDVPPDLRRDADSDRAFVSRSLKDLLREGRFKGRRAVASINSAQSYVQHVRLPKGDATEIDQQIEMELRGRLPLDPTQLVIRHVTVGEVITGGVPKQEVICMAASRESILGHVRVARAAGLNVVGAHCEPMAILAAFKHLFRRAGDAERTTLFIDIGAAATKALIAHGSQLAFAKTIHVGGDHFTRQLAEELGVEVGKARMERIRHAAEQSAAAKPRAAQAGEVETPGGRGRRRSEGGGIATLTAPEGPTTMGGRHAAESHDPSDASEDGDMLDALVDELQLCVGYHESMFPDRPIEKAVFLGGESRQITMCQRIAQALRLPAQLGDPLARLVRPPNTPPPMGVDLRDSQPGWAVPLGMCLLPTNL